MKAHRNRGLTRVEIAALIAGILALNIAGAIIYKVRGKAAPVPTVQGGAPASSDEVEMARFKALRASGLTALSTGDYARAVEQFTEALKYGKADSDIIELLKMAKEFKEGKTQKAEPEPPPEREPEPAPEPAAAVVEKAEKPERVAVAAKVPPRPKPVVRRPEPVRQPEPVRKPEPVREPEPAKGSLLVTSSPSGLVVEVDGTRRDFTPAKVVVTVGSHVVSIWKGGARLFQRTLEVEPNQVALVDADLTAQLAPPPVAKVEPPPEPVKEVVPEKPPEKAKEPPPPPRPVEPVVVAAPVPVAPASAATGELLIESLNVYGEVFVNGVSVGFPPVVAKKLPTEQTTIEVRVDGAVRRKRVVEVVANKRTTVRIP